MPKIVRDSREDIVSSTNYQEIEEKRKEIYRNMSAEQKLTIAAELYYAALNLKKAHLQRVHPDWSQSKVEDKARKWMLYART